MLNRKLFDLYSSLFPVSSNVEFKALLLYVVWITIKKNPGITENKLKWLLNNQFSFEETNIDLALSALTNPSIFNCVSKFQHTLKKSKRDVTHLRPKKEQMESMGLWEEYLTKNNPSLAELEVSSV